MSTAHAQFIDRPAQSDRFSDLYLVPHGGGYFRLVQPFVYMLPADLADELGGPLVHVPEGFITDLDSVPRLPLVYWLAKGRTVLATLPHDWLYVAARLTPDPASPPVTREQADRVMRAAMLDEGVAWPWRRLIYRAIRVGGAGGWADSRQLQRETGRP